MKKTPKILTETKRKQLEKYELIRSEYAEMTSDGSNKSPVAKILADKYGYTTCQINNIVNHRGKL